MDKICFICYTRGVSNLQVLGSVFVVFMFITLKEYANFWVFVDACIIIIIYDNILFSARVL